MPLFPAPFAVGDQPKVVVDPRVNSVPGLMNTPFTPPRRSRPAPPKFGNSIVFPPAVQPLPLVFTANRLVPLLRKSTKLPAKPLAAFTPRPVPLVFQPVEVVPVGSIRNCGLVVVADPPVKIVPFSSNGGVDAAPLVDWITCPVRVPPASGSLVASAPPPDDPNAEVKAFRVIMVIR